jgi:colanic acid/amylovoran biosynthesis protein
MTKKIPSLKNSVLRIALFCYCCHNFGDDLFLKSLENHYHSSNVLFLMFCPKKFCISYENEFLLIKPKESDGFGHRIFQKTCRVLNLSSNSVDDLAKKKPVVYLGGSTFSFKDDFKEEWIPGYFSSKRKVFVLGTNFGPVKDLRYVNLYREIFRGCSDVCFRDKKSFEIFKDVPTVRYTTDLAFSLFDQIKRLEPLKKEKIVIIAPKFIDTFNTFEKWTNEQINVYEKKLFSIAENYKKNGYNVIFFGSCCFYEFDMILCKKLSREIYFDESHCMEYSGDNLNSVIDLFRRAKIVVGVRHHSVIMGLICGCEVIPILYSKKTEQILLDFGFYGPFSSAQNIDDSLLFPIMASSEKLEEASKKSSHTFDKLDEFLTINYIKNQE